MKDGPCDIGGIEGNPGGLYLGLSADLGGRVGWFL